MTDDGRDFNPHADPDWTPLKPRPRKPERIGQPRASKPDDIQAALDRIIPDMKARDAKRFPREREQARRRAERADDLIDGGWEVAGGGG